MSSEQERKKLNLPSELYDHIEERAKTTGFGSADDYVIFILEEVLKDEGKDEDRAFSKEEEEDVKKRLKALGYID